MRPLLPFRFITLINLILPLEGSASHHHRHTWGEGATKCGWVCGAEINIYGANFDRH